MERKFIRLEKSKDQFINFNFNNKADVFGNQESLNNFSDSELEKSINPSIDNELIRFTPNMDVFNINMNFLNLNPSNDYDYISPRQFTQVGFTQKEVDSESGRLQNSYFIFEYFNSDEESNQIRLSTNFIKANTKYSRNNSNSIRTQIRANQSFESEHNMIYIPKFRINLGLSECYLRVSFFNATNGKRSYFFFNDSTPSTSTIITKEKMYYKVYLFKDSFQWNISPINSFNVYTRDVYELPKSKSPSSNREPNIGTSSPLNGGIKNIVTSTGEII